MTSLSSIRDKFLNAFHIVELLDLSLCDELLRILYLLSHLNDSFCLDY